MKRPPKRSTIEVDGFFDIETEGWSRFVVGGFLTHKGFSAYDWKKEDELADAILSFDGSIWAHNGGRYDTLWLLEHAARRRLRARLFCAGSAITCAEIGTRLRIFDSARLVPMALMDAAEIAGQSKDQTGLPCVCPETKNCGGYCSIKRNMPRKLLSRLIEYLRRDCEVGWNILKKLSDYAEENDLDLRGTIGASTWATARRRLGIESASWSGGDYTEARAGYYGGRVEVFRPVAKAGRSYDINSAYPYALTQVDLPTGERVSLTGGAASKAYRVGTEGIYVAKVSVPRIHIPPLPARGAARIGFPTGQFWGSWTALELRYAESVGARLEKISRAIVWKSANKVLAPYCQEIWNLREKAGPKTALGKWLKLYANSLTGKLAQRMEVESVYMFADGPPPACPADYQCRNIHTALVKRCCEHKCWRTCGTYESIGGSPILWSRPEYRPSPCSHVQWAAYLTAHARTEQLHRQLVDDEQGGESVVYCDTDSCYTVSTRSQRIGAALGEWKDQGPFSDFLAIAPKTYRYNDADGEPCAASKGIPDAVANFALIEAGESVPISRGVWTLKTGARKGELFGRREMSRRIRAPAGGRYGSRILDGDLTRPMTYDEFAAL